MKRFATMPATLRMREEVSPVCALSLCNWILET